MCLLLLLVGCKVATPQLPPDAAVEHQPVDQIIEDPDRCCPLDDNRSCELNLGGSRRYHTLGCPILWDVPWPALTLKKHLDDDGCPYWDIVEIRPLEPWCPPWEPPYERLEPPREPVLEPLPEPLPEPPPEPPVEKPCPPSCTLGTKKCGPMGGIQTCGVEMDTGCTAWGAEECSTACTGKLPSWCPSPTPTPTPTPEPCKPTPAACTGVSIFPTTLCGTETSLATCAKSAAGCVTVSSVECPYPQICSGDGAKTCACPIAQTDPKFDPKTRYRPGTGCTKAESDSTDKKVKLGCDPISGQVVRCEPVSGGVASCFIWVAQPACLAGEKCTTGGTHPDGSPMTAPHCG